MHTYMTIVQLCGVVRIKICSMLFYVVSLALVLCAKKPPLPLHLPKPPKSSPCCTLCLARAPPQPPLRHQNYLR